MACGIEHLAPSLLPDIATLQRSHSGTKIGAGRITSRGVDLPVVKYPAQARAHVYQARRDAIAVLMGALPSMSARV
jgi:hypothetical protein